MSKIMFDEPRVNEMQHFLTYLYDIGKNNKGLEISDGLIYRELRKYELGKDDRGIDEDGLIIQDMFKKWIIRNNEMNSFNKGMTVKHDPSWYHFLQYYSTVDQGYMTNLDKFIKLYLPFKNKKLFESVNELFDFITKSKIKHTSKVADRIRSDNVIVRLDKNDVSSALKIIDFVNKNEIIKNNLNKTNPFVPTINGIGFMFETGISYNEEISTMISKYIKECLLNKKPPVLGEFYRWFKNNNRSAELDDIFSYAIGQKKSLEYDEKLAEDNKYRLLIEALKVTFLKYDFSQSVVALKKLLDENDYSYFTNGNGEIKYRKELVANVSREDANRYVKMYVDANKRYGSYYPSYLEQPSDDLLIFTCVDIFKKELLPDFKEACRTTYLNYDEEQLQKALEEMIESGDSKRFSRFSIDDSEHNKNYRDIITKYGQIGVQNLIKLTLDTEGIKYNKENVVEMISQFTKIIVSLSDEIKEERNNRK